MVDACPFLSLTANSTMAVRLITPPQKGTGASTMTPYLFVSNPPENKEKTTIRRSRSETPKTGDATIDPYQTRISAELKKDRRKLQVLLPLTSR